MRKGSGAGCPWRLPAGTAMVEVAAAADAAGSIVNFTSWMDKLGQVAGAMPGAGCASRWPAIRVRDRIGGSGAMAMPVRQQAEPSSAGTRRVALAVAVAAAPGRRLRSWFPREKPGILPAPHPLAVMAPPSRPLSHRVETGAVSLVGVTAGNTMPGEGSHRKTKSSVAARACVRASAG